MLQVNISLLIYCTVFLCLLLKCFVTNSKLFNSKHNNQNAEKSFTKFRHKLPLKVISCPSSWEQTHQQFPISSVRYSSTSEVSSHHRHRRIARVTYGRILAGMRRDVLERPVDVLMRGQVPPELCRLLTTQTQQAVVRGEHGTVVHDHVMVIVIRPENK